MKKIKFFQTRPLGERTGNFALSYRDAKKLLEKHFDTFEIVETSSFGIRIN